MDTYRNDLLFPKESYNIVGAAMKVQAELGSGFVEKVYQDALAVQFQKDSIPFQREVELHVLYDGVTLSSTFKPDFICYDRIVVELKAVKELDDMHRAQALNYAKVAGCRLALLLNFGDLRLVYERLPILK